MASEHPNGDGNGRTFAGGGFGTIQMRRVVGEDPPPAPVSARAYLRTGLPAVYREGDFGMRFVGALEHLLDPVVALLDNLPAHFDPRHAPPDVLELLAAWLGQERDEFRLGEERRELVRGAAELLRLRGTRAGLELALELAFPGVPFRIEDGGGVSWSTEPDTPPPVGRPSFVVYCEQPVPEDTQAAIARLIERSKPAHTGFRLRVKAPRARAKEEGP
ncbi:MAG TPA: phage tail protein [Solirubrobacteraceae bacterium]|nr:phage tail protein [Solirubrobacteraceae bacterium]